MSLINKMPRLAPIRGAAQLESVRAAAAVDGHELLGPSHVVLQDEVIAGAFSVGNVPLVTMWLDSNRVAARGSFSLINTVENLVFATGQAGGAVLVEESSPFYPVMEALGYRNRGRMVLFTKGI